MLLICKNRYCKTHTEPFVSFFFFLKLGHIHVFAKLENVIKCMKNNRKTFVDCRFLYSLIHNTASYTAARYENMGKKLLEKYISLF